LLSGQLFSIVGLGLVIGLVFGGYESAYMKSGESLGLTS